MSSRALIVEKMLFGLNQDVVFPVWATLSCAYCHSTKTASSLGVPSSCTVLSILVGLLGTPELEAKPESPGKEQAAPCWLGNALGFLSLAHGRLRACILALLGEPIFTGCPCHQSNIWCTETHFPGILWRAQCDLSV